jgi:hypothetical protein
VPSLHKAPQRSSSSVGVSVGFSGVLVTFGGFVLGIFGVKVNVGGMGFKVFVADAVQDGEGVKFSVGVSPSASATQIMR